MGGSWASATISVRASGVFPLHEYYDWLDQGQDLVSRDVAHLSKVAVQISLGLDPLVWGIFCSFSAVPWGSTTGKCRCGNEACVSRSPRDKLWHLNPEHFIVAHIKLVIEMKRLGKTWLPAKHRDRTIVAIPVGPTSEDVMVPRLASGCADLTCSIPSSVSMG